MCGCSHCDVVAEGGAGAVQPIQIGPQIEGQRGMRRVVLLVVVALCWLAPIWPCLSRGTRWCWSLAAAGCE